MEDIVKRLRARQSMRTWSGTGDTPKQVLAEDALCHEAANEIASLRVQLDEAVKDADNAIEHARRVDAREREALRDALANLVQVYVIDGADTTPASKIGEAWEAAQRALLKV